MAHMSLGQDQVLLEPPPESVADVANIPIGPQAAAPLPGTVAASLAEQAARQQAQQAASTSWFPGISNTVVLMIGAGIALIAFAGGRR